VFEANHLQAIQGAVTAGLGITPMLPNALQSPQLRFVEAGILPQLPTVEIGLGRRPGSEADRTVDALEALIRNVLG
jgi:DNA-binding transcriptional LysR family regulator